MGKSTKEYYDILITEKQATASLNGLTPAVDDSQTFLNDLSSNSKVSKWRLMLWVVAFGYFVLDQLFDIHKAEVEALAKTLIPATLPWYQVEGFKFQFGDLIQWNSTTNKYEYLVYDDAKRIIKRCAVIEEVSSVGLSVRVKAAKLDGNGDPVPLTAAELNSFSIYMKKIRPAGIALFVISKPADLLKLAMDITYDPLVMNPDGSLINDAAVFPAVDAIDDYLSTLDFNGVFNLTKLVDAAQSAEGVIDPILTLAEATHDALPYATVVQNYKASAGYMVVDPLFPLSTQITYIANV